MKKPVPRLRFIISVIFVLCLFVVFQIHKSDLFGKTLQTPYQVNNIFISIASSSSSHRQNFLTKYSNESDGNRAKHPDAVETDTCAGRYIYMHDLPSLFNDDIIKNCRTLIKWFNICPFIVNSGLGPQVLEYANKTPQVLTTKTGSWYSTNQFLLSVIFRERMKHYECLTNDSSQASAIYIPYFAGLDVGRHLWGYNTMVRDALGTKLARWLRERPEWRKMHGRDHFFVAGRIGWDFRRCSDEASDWGSNLMCLPEFSNTTMLSIETTAWTNEFALPYPTYFHPKSLTEVRIWQRKVKSVERTHLFCFVGAPRPKLDGSIRGEIIKQCLASHGTCKFLNCNEPGKDCDNPVKIMDAFERSVFCLQPPGDSYTRRSIFDSILAGCIPVFFHPGSGYKQYRWYFPKDYTKYSVYIPENGMKNGTVSLRNLLGRIDIDKESVLRMRNEVVKIIPKIIYTKPGLVGSEKIEDAFDIAVDRVIERVTMVKRMMEEGKDIRSEYSQIRDLRKLE
ncbi:probable xyloglucan galactosyltransferase GT12 [Raphanus sativus]|uniref:Probable xyloglucan galactosyltransferase GT12 n=1 Tax=Raphanus sativus TaxID=3726 RepID=A0A6J0JVZ9_RAPSA|nr:probable xyloglucan galactosyltransferase GT12 [Raphanus sativus]